MLTWGGCLAAGQCIRQCKQVFANHLDSKVLGRGAPEAALGQPLHFVHQILTLVTPSQFGGHVSSQHGKVKQVVIH